MYHLSPGVFLKFTENQFNMEKEKLDKIIAEQKNLKDLPNQKLIEFMDLLSTEFDETKKILINQTIYLDNLEILYNNVLKEYQNRA